MADLVPVRTRSAPARGRFDIVTADGEAVDVFDELAKLGSQLVQLKDGLAASVADLPADEVPDSPELAALLKVMAQTERVLLGRAQLDADALAVALRVRALDEVIATVTAAVDRMGVTDEWKRAFLENMHAVSAERRGPRP